MKTIGLTLLLLTSWCLGAQTPRPAGPPTAGRTLIVYFSHSGHTREIADEIQREVGGDRFEIQTVEPYPSDYDTVVKQARTELDTGFRPRLKGRVPHLEAYRMIFLGYPIWWGTVPRAVAVFLSENNLAGKTLAPFCTHEGSHLGQSVEDIRKLCPQTSLLDGLAIRGRDAGHAQGDVSAWLRKLAPAEPR